MEKFLKNWFINSVALGSLAWFYNGIAVSFTFPRFFLTTLILSLIIKVIKPLFDLVFLPINILTLGLFRCLRTAVAFAVLAYVIKYIQIEKFYFPGFNLGAISINAFEVSPLISLIIGSFLFNLIKKAIYWLIKKK